jgi:hypothetical protein
MALTLTSRIKRGLALVPAALIVLGVGYGGGRVWWYRGYTRGSHTGWVRKVEVRGRRSASTSKVR